MSNPHDHPTALKDLQDSIYREKVLRARAMTPAERLDSVFELSDLQLGMMLGGAMHRLPGRRLERSPPLARSPGPCAGLSLLCKPTPRRGMTLVELATAVFETAETMDVLHMAVGAIAAGAYGIPRATKDIDLLVSVDQSRGIHQLMDGLGKIVEFDQ